MPATYTAVVQQDGEWWIGWVQEVPGVNSQGETRAALLDNLREALGEAIEMNRQDAKSAWAFEVVELNDRERSSGVGSFLRGVGSVLELFPSPERFNRWRLG